MGADARPPSMSYTAPQGAAERILHLVFRPGSPEEQSFDFCNRIEIGRFHLGREGEPGVLLVSDPTISRRHCIVTQAPDGRCYVRDVSTNGTWLQGRRLVPNIETRVEPGQMISLGNGVDLRLGSGRETPAQEQEAVRPHSTIRVTGWTTATVLVGDIRNYTVLVREAPADVLQQSVNRVFAELETTVAAHGGTVKEYPGDAVFAFWDERSIENHATAACRAALALDRRVRGLAADRGIWSLADHPLRMDWALTTGRVVIESIGGDRPTGLAMVGEPVVLAFRLEKLADESTGPILTCRATREMGGDAFVFRTLQEMSAEGFGRLDDVFALVSERQ